MSKFHQISGIIRKMGKKLLYYFFRFNCLYFIFQTFWLDYNLLVLLNAYTSSYKKKNAYTSMETNISLSNK